MNKNSNHNLAIPVELGKSYHFAGYEWTVCEVDKERNAAVLQSHGVTHGEWPGYILPQFGNGNYYESDIDGLNISDYNETMSTLYDTIKDAEDTSAGYGKGLYLISKKKVGFTELGELGSGNYWKSLKTAVTGAYLFSGAWLGTFHYDKGAWYVYSNGNVYYGNYQKYDFIVAPAFNLDLSKIEVIGDKIIIKNTNNKVKKEKIRECLDEIYKESEILPENFGEEIVTELEERFLEDGYEITKETVIEEMLWCYMCKMQ